MNTKNRAGHILLIEDNRMDVELTMSAFREHRVDNEIHVALGGQAGLDYLFGQDEYADRSAHPLPDLVLLDLKMPVVDGHEVLRRIRCSDKLRRIPVVVLSSSNEEGDLASSYDFGANSFLVKPISFDDFVHFVSLLQAYWLTINVPSVGVH
jgi:CheY-like chemotaxis protein